MTARERRVVKFGAAICGTLLLVRLATTGTGRYLSAADQLATRRLLFAAAERDLASFSALADSGRRLREGMDQVAGRLFPVRSPDAAIDLLAAEADRLGRRNGARVVSVELIADSAAFEGYGRFLARVTLESDLHGGLLTTRALELGRPDLVVQTLRVEAVNPESSREQPEVLLFEALVAGVYPREIGKPER